MALHRWAQAKWAMACEALEARGLDLVEVSRGWQESCSTDPFVAAAPDDPGLYGWGEDDIILDDERHRWLVAALAGEIEPVSA